MLSFNSQKGYTEICSINLLKETLQNAFVEYCELRKKSVLLVTIKYSKLWQNKVLRKCDKQKWWHRWEKHSKTK